MESSNAWERAQDAIARAAARSDEVVTPDNAVSPFDASMTTVIPQANVVRRGPPDPDSTQRLPHGRPPTPRRPGDAAGWPGPPARSGEHADRGRREPPPRPPELSDPAMPRVAPARPNTAPFPAADPFPAGEQNGHATTPPRRSPWWKRLFGR